MVTTLSRLYLAWSLRLCGVLFYQSDLHLSASNFKGDLIGTLVTLKHVRLAQKE